MLDIKEVKGRKNTNCHATESLKVRRMILLSNSDQTYQAFIDVLTSIDLGKDEGSTASRNS